MTDWAFQLYSARNTPLPKALQIVAEAGYTSVEAFGENFVEQNLFRDSLAESGLTVVSAHLVAIVFGTHQTKRLKLRRRLA